MRVGLVIFVYANCGNDKLAFCRAVRGGSEKAYPVAFQESIEEEVWVGKRGV